MRLGMLLRDWCFWLPRRASFEMLAPVVLSIVLSEQALPCQELALQKPASRNLVPKPNVNETESIFVTLRLAQMLLTQFVRAFEKEPTKGDSTANFFSTDLRGGRM